MMDLRRLGGSMLFKTLVSLLTYAFYAVVLGVSLAVPIDLAFRFVPRVWHGPSAISLLGASIIMSASVFVWFIWAAFVFALVIRIFCKSLKPGRYPAYSLTTLRWTIGSGVYMLATKTFLPFIQMSPFILMFFRIIGARIGKDVWMNTYHLNDAYLMDIEDGAVLGGESIISAHIYENDQLVLGRIHIGRGALIGTCAYVGPGCDIGDHAVIGMYAHVRKFTVVPPYHSIHEMGGISARQLVRMRQFDRSPRTKTRRLECP